MAQPGNVTTVVVLGTFLTPEGDPSTGTITFTPSRWLNNPGANVAVPNSSVTKTLGTAGNFSAVLPVTDDGDLTPANWYYTVSEVVDGVSQSYDILLPGSAATSGTVYLADIAPAAALGPEFASTQGPAGSAATITIGTTTSVSNSGTASVTNSGSTSAAILNFVLRDGPTGPANTLTIGTVTTVAPGGTATASITGTAPSQVLNLGLVRGDTGALTTSGSGSVGTAAVSPSGDPDTGIYYPAANQVAVTTGGTQALLLASGAVSNPTITGVATFAAGTVSAPAITTTGDTNTGIFFPAADTVAIAEGGVEVLRVNSSGQVSVPDVSASAPSITNTGDENTGIAFPSDNTLIIATDGAQRMQVNATGDIGFGVNASSGYWYFFGKDMLVRRDSAVAALSVNTRSATAGHYSVITLDHNNASNSTTPDNAEIGQIHFNGRDTAGAYMSPARISSSIGTNASGGAPGLLSFWTAPSGSSPLERQRIDSNGLITGTGTSLGAWTAYTPTLGGTGWALGNGTITAAYAQIGKLVAFRIRVLFGSTSTFGASAAPTLTFPVTARSGLNSALFVSGQLLDASTAAVHALQTVQNDTTTMTVYYLATNSAITAITATAPFTLTTDDVIRINGVYEAA